jgi:hypothetical protein
VKELVISIDYGDKPGTGVIMVATREDGILYVQETGTLDLSKLTGVLSIPFERLEKFPEKMKVVIEAPCDSSLLAE